MGQKIVTLCQLFYRGFVKFSFNLSIGPIWRKKIEKLKVLFMIIGHLTNKFQPLVMKNFEWMSNLHFNLSKGTFIEKNEKILSVSKSEPQSFGLLAKLFLRVSQFGKNLLYLSIWDSGRKILTFFQNVLPAVVSKLHSTCPSDHYDDFFWKQLFVWLSDTWQN